MPNFDIERTLNLLNIEEKIGLLGAVDFWHTFPVPRLNIPSIRVSDGPNGVRGTKLFDAVASAAFPNGTALASTFDKELLLEAGILMAKEAKFKNVSVILGPTANIQRGPLGGRGFESFSEDPYLSGIASASIVNGIQSEGIAATMKHFICNDLEDQRFSSNSIVTERAFREIYLEPFRLALKYSQPRCFMTSYNKVNGVHCSQDKELLLNILRNELQFSGIVISDWLGTYSSSESIKNGLDIEFPGPPKWRSKELISHLLNSKELITTNDVDDRVCEILSLVKYVVDQSPNTHVIENGPETEGNNTEETAIFLRKLAASTAVLLKNDKNILPLRKDLSTAVIGPNAKASCYSGGGSASLKAYYLVTPYEGIIQKVRDDTKVEYTVGANSYKSLPPLLEHLIVDPSAKLGGTNVGAKASFYLEPREKRKFNAKKIYETTIKESEILLYDFKSEYVDPAKPIFYADIEGYLIPEEDGQYEFGLQVSGTGLLFIDDVSIIDNKSNQKKGDFSFGSGTIEEKATISLKGGVLYKVGIEYGSAHTSEIPGAIGCGSLHVGYRKCTDDNEEINRAVQIAQNNEQVILCIGLNGEWESEGYDRKDMSLPPKVNNLVEAVLRANPNTVVVNQSGTPVELPWLDKCSALVQFWYGGNELGNAIADILFGDVTPSGKLSLSWPRSLFDTPTYLNFATEGGRVLYGEDIYVGYRFYEKVHRRVEFPFGYGLSYTKFILEGLKVVCDENSDSLTITLKVTNTGKEFTGAEVVQVYIAADSSTISRPSKELKGFTKVFLAPCEAKTVKLSISLKDSTSFFDEISGKWCSEAGTYKALVGNCVDDTPLTGEFTITQTSYWTGL